MNPLFNIYLGGTIGLAAIATGLIKLSRPVSRWHRMLGRGIGLLTAMLLFAMVSRAAIYQEAFSVSIWIHMMVGGIAISLLFMKFLVAWKQIPFPRWLRPIGFLLLLLLPLTALGKSLPVALAWMEWKPLTPEEILRDPDPSAFDKGCCRCHSRETATEGYGQRPPARWIEIVQPMAWAGGLPRENCRGALASLLIPFPGTLATATTSIAVSDPISHYCVACHSQNRIFQTKRTKDEWRKITARMQKLTRENAAMEPLSDEAISEVISFLEKQENQ